MRTTRKLLAAASGKQVLGNTTLVNEESKYLQSRAQKAVTEVFRQADQRLQ
jgi:hypothetical protein